MTILNLVGQRLRKDERLLSFGMRGWEVPIGSAR